jgi:hypothetical protein
MPGVTPVFTMGPKRPPSRRALTVLMVFGGITGMMFLAASFTGIQRYLEFRNQGVTVNAKITNMEVLDGATNRLTQHLITYTYTDNSVTHTTSKEVDRDFFSQLGIGDTITIRYLEADPGQSTITGQGVEGSEWLEGIVVALLIGTVMILLPLTEIVSRMRKLG